MSTLNRLQTHWKTLNPRILKEWNRLTDSDLEYTEGEFDRLVEVIKQRYDGPVYKVSEEVIRYVVLQMLKEVEN